MQGLANKTLRVEGILSKVLKELSVSLINAVVLSALILVYNLIFSDSYALTLSVSSALFIVIIFASVFGTLVPMALNHFKIDPAIATGPFITTANDIVGLLIYMSLGAVMYEIIG